MKSLQIVTPHLECIYKCPFCISKAHPYTSHFDNNYNHNFELWKDNLIKVLLDNKDLAYVVITGTNEPMQSPECVNDIINIVREFRPDISIEIQTRWYNKNDIYKELDTTCYSISNAYYLDKIKPVGNNMRYVIILTDSFNGLTLDNYLSLIPKEVNQITFKTLQNSSSHDTEIDGWIDEHRVDEETLKRLEQDVANYKGNISIRMDKTCMDATDRYMVFREDGYLYRDWDELPKEKQVEQNGAVKQYVKQ